MSDRARRIILVVVSLVGPFLLGIAELGFAQGDRDALVARIQREIAAIRGVPFERPITAADQSVEAFRAYVDRQIERQIPKRLLDNYGKIAAKLGLYRGPRIDDFGALAARVVTSQAVAYYDPDKSSFFVVMSDLSPAVLGPTYAHELYHGLQDQRHDLRRYLLPPGQVALNDDESLARQAVVEGEATYVMTLWLTETMMGSKPDRAVLRPMIELQASMDTAALSQLLESPAASSLGSDIGAAAAAMDELPAFLIENMVGSYLKGMRFVFEIQASGWKKVDELYSNPPVSTEQILHPRKWLAGERPFRYTWPDLEAVPALAGWRLLEKNVLGELQLRTVFKTHGATPETAARAAEGWNGDAYAVLERSESGDLLLLWLTSWDDAAEAVEFEKAYARLLEQKYASTAEVTKVVRRNKNVLIVEGGVAAATDSYLTLLSSLENAQ